MRRLVLTLSLFFPAVAATTPVAIAPGDRILLRKGNGQAFSMTVIPSVAPATPLGPQVDRYLAPLQEIDSFQGVVLVTHGNKVLLRKGYGLANVELGVPNTPDRVFRIASLSKPFTEVALGTLIDSGKLSLTDPLSRWLPAFPSADSITLDMIRTHRAGIPSRNSLVYDEESLVPNTLDSLVHAIAAMPLDSRPGSRVRYSNGGYAILAFVIEKASGRTYATYLQEAVCKPLRLSQTRHETDTDLVPNRAFGYMTDPASVHGLVVAPYQQMETKTGGGSLVSTADDLDRVLRAFHHELLQPATWNSLFPSDSTDSFQGRCPGYNVAMTRDYAHDLDVIVLANNYSAAMVGTIADDVLAMARGEERKPSAWRAGVPLAPGSSTLVGMWRMERPGPPLGPMAFGLERRGGALLATLGGQPVDALLPQGEGRYLSRALWSEFVAAGDSLTMRPLWLDRPPARLVRVTP
jgi:CubicO group peptidase (beta-lactamase class C family)